MRKLTALIVTFLLVLTSTLMAYQGYDVDYKKLSNGNSFELDYNIGDFNISEKSINGTTYSMINFGGNVSTTEKGYAALPFIHATVELLSNNDITLKVVESDYVDYDLDFPLIPSRGTIYRNQDPSTIPYEIASESITDSWYPKNLTYNAEPFILRDIRGTSIYVNPFRYNAEKNILRVYTSVKVVAVEDFKNSTNSLNVANRKIAPQMDGMYKSLFINYNQSGRWEHEIGQSGEILVIHTSRDADAIIPYIQWKTEKGFVVTRQEVATGTNVTSTIQDAYDANNNILYVQLVGDWADIKSNLGGGANAPMDPMLGCVVGTDAFTDIIIGRFSAQSPADVTIQVNKTITYEKTPESGATWYKNGSGIGSTQGSGSGDDGEADYVHLGVIKDDKLEFTTYTTVHEDYEPSVTSADVANHVNAGLSVMNYCGHGSHSAWSSSGFSNSNVSSLTNGDMLPFIVSVACVNGEFHNGGDCFAEAWLKKENGGAIVFSGATINQPWAPPMRGQDYFNDLITGGYDYSTHGGQTGIMTDEGRTFYGSAFANAMNLMYTESNGGSDLETIQTWTIFGDASLQIRTDTPAAISNSNSTVFVGQTFETTITAGGNPVEGAMVSLSKDEETFSGITDASGQVSIDHSIMPGVATLVVTGFNTETIYTDIAVATLSGPFVIIEDYEVLDANNGEVDYGETVQFTVTLKNVGTETSNNITSLLTTESGFVTVDDDSETVASLAPDASVTLTGAYEATFVSQIEDQTSVAFVLTMNDDSDSEYIGGMNFSVNAPAFEFEVTHEAVNPGDTRDLVYSLTNVGHADAANVNAVLSQITSLDIIINDASQTIGDITVGNTEELTFTIEFDESISTGSTASFNLETTDAQNVVNNYGYSLTVGMTENFEAGDFTNPNWTFGGTADWEIVEPGFESVYSAKSGTITHSQTSEMSLEIDYIYPNGSIVFCRKVSSEGNYDYLKFYIDGSMQDEWSGVEEWASVSYDVADAGTHTFKWEYYKDGSVSSNDDCAWVDDILATDGVGIDDNENLTPLVTSLSQNYPNPFNPTTTINFANTSLGNVKLSIFNSKGEFVTELVNNVMEAGFHSVQFNAAQFNSGVYFYKITADGVNLTKKMLLVK